MTSAFKTWWLWVSADCPKGPLFGALVFVASVVLVGVFVMPPALWAAGKILGPWWRYWLH